MKRGLILLLTLVLLLSWGCKTPTKPVNIAKISTVKDKEIGANVEFSGWVESVAGASDVGFELNMTETPNNFPRAFVDLKEGQPDPGINIQVCVRGKLFYKEDERGGLLIRIQQAELIDCY
jgi:hypothetical protein